MAKRKRSSAAPVPAAQVETPVSLPLDMHPPSKTRAKRTQHKVTSTVVDPDLNEDVVDGPDALRCSPSAVDTVQSSTERAAGASNASTESKKKPVKSKSKVKAKATQASTAGEDVDEDIGKEVKVEAVDSAIPALLDPEADNADAPGTAEELKEALTRPPPVNSDYLPLPWKGRLGYACLCTYLRYAKPPVFSSRTCRIASILEQRHPLKDPSLPAHTIKNRPDRDQPADVARGQAFVESLGLANAKDIVKMLRWNDKYGIKFFRLSSEMFPFASHDLYGYKLAPFASDALAEAGKVAAELGHRLTTHPGQFTQLGSPRQEVIKASIRDLDYHAELLGLLKLPPQQDRDAVMILHMGGVFGDKEATLDRFRKNYTNLSKNVKARLVLENDDVSWSVHDLLPVCKELNIPLVLDYHHHNIIHSDTVREGTLDIMNLYDEILETWKRKNVTPKMHYSEPTPSAITPRQRRKHSPRVATLPSCPPDMDLMIEAKDKEQAVFELMRNFKLPGHERIGDLLPHIRNDENQPDKPKKGKKSKKAEEVDEMDEASTLEAIPENEVSMGGPDGRVYWPPGMEEWLRPVVKRVVNKKETGEPDGKAKATPKKSRKIAAGEESSPPKIITAKKAKATPNKTKSPRKKSAKVVPTPSLSDEGSSSDALLNLSEAEERPPKKPSAGARRLSGRAKKINYAEDD
ncbi:MAG: UV-damage endonuclease [Piccolia ochrophora]|nr:MAG: UV-damage endonuclease [Piccolia ochrophora]